MRMDTETSEASRIRPTTLADMDPSAREAHMNDARIMAHITMVREDMGKLSRDMEAFNRHPEIMKASQNAEKYGMPQAAALHQALDQNPKLKDAFLKLHDRAMAIQPKVENAMGMAQGLSPKHSGTAEASLQHGLEGIQKQAAHWPDPADIGAQNSNATKGQPGLIAMIGHLLKKLKEMFTGKKHKDELEHGHTAAASHLDGKGAVKPTATESPARPAEPAAGRPTIRRKP